MNPEDEVRGKLQGMARWIKGELPSGYGFVLLVASLGERGVTLYVANIGRLDALQLMREFVAMNVEERVFQREMPELEPEAEFEGWYRLQVERDPKQELRRWCRDAYMAGRASR